MFAKIAKVLGGAVLVVLAGVGVLAVVVVWKLAAWVGDDGGAHEKKAMAVVAPVVVAPVAPLVSETVATDCACSSGAECVGTRGGKYCLDGAGKKKYKGQQ